MYRLFSKKASLGYNIRQLKYLIPHIKTLIHRAKYGWAPVDTWNMDMYMMEVWSQMLTHLRNNHWAYPGCEGASTPDEWDNLLDRMIFLLKEMNEDTCSEQNEVWDAYWESGCKKYLDKGAYVARCDEIMTYQEKCKKEFFKLFEEYFYTLWD